MAERLDAVSRALPAGRHRAMVAGLAVSISVAYGCLLYGFSVFITREAAGDDFSTSLLSAAFGGSVLVGALCAPGVGRHVDRHGIRGIIVTGAVLGGTGLTLFAAAEQPWHVLVAWWLLLGPAAAMTFYEPAYVVIDQWCAPVQRVKAIAAMTLFGGLGGPISIAAVTWLVERLGWRSAALVLAAVFAVTLTVVGVALLPGPPHVLRHAATDQPPADDRPRIVSLGRRFAVFTVAGVLIYGAFEAMVLHRIARFEAAGFDLAAVSRWAVVAGVVSLPGRFLLPRLGATRRPTMLLAVVAVVMAVATGFAVAPSTDVELAAHFVVFGVVLGAALPLRAVAMARWYSGVSFGWMMGVQAAWIGVARAGLPFVAGLGRQRVGEGITMAALCVALLTGAALVIMSERVPDQ